MDWFYLLGVSCGDSVYFSGDPDCVQAARDDVRVHMRQDFDLSQRVQVIDRDPGTEHQSWYAYALQVARMGKNDGHITVFVDRDYVDGTMPKDLHGSIHAHAHFWPDGQMSVVKQRAPVVNDDVLKMMLGRRL